MGWWADLSGQGGLLLVAAPAASSGDPPEIEPHCTALDCRNVEGSIEVYWAQ